MDFTPYRKFSDTLIETGTHIGESVRTALEAGFKVKTVEVHEPFFNAAVSRFMGNSNVQFFFGKSVDLLPEMIKDIPIPSVFWLDAHPTGPNTGGHDDLMSKGEKSEFHQDNILKKELEIILAHGEHVILIDDVNGWKNARNYINIIDDKNPVYRYSLIDEIRPGVHYVEKVLVCLPVF